MVIVSICLMLAAVTACSSNTGNTSDQGTHKPIATPPLETSTEHTTKPVEKLEALLQKELSKTKDAAEAVAATERYLKGATVEQADAMFTLLEGFYGSNLQEAEAQVSNPDVQQKLLKLKWPITLEQAAQLKDTKLKDLLAMMNVKQPRICLVS
ncbi:hypothetical protein [Paenibacillus guangzhouensis]|uniref:hypothetical protein n=1 Tax=Paenibacillus guangzhouensis TaxID=1473112 RepID=UPI00187B7521|nr:hypothetical protein [Paenibacillus guangzhouensis]